MNTDLQMNPWEEIVAKAWQDDAFKKRLLENPAAAFKDQGLQTPAGVQIRVVEDTPTLVHLTLPANPQDGELSDDQLEGVAGGSFMDALFKGVSSVSKEIPNVVSDQVNGKTAAFARAAFGSNSSGTIGSAAQSALSQPRPL